MHSLVSRTRSSRRPCPSRASRRRTAVADAARARDAAARTARGERPAGRPDVGVERRAESLRLVGRQALLFDQRMHTLDEEVAIAPGESQTLIAVTSPFISQANEATRADGGSDTRRSRSTHSSNSASGAVTRSMNTAGTVVERLRLLDRVRRQGIHADDGQHRIRAGGPVQVPNLRLGPSSTEHAERLEPAGTQRGDYRPSAQRPFLPGTARTTVPRCDDLSPRSNSPR